MSTHNTQCLGRICVSYQNSMAAFALSFHLIILAYLLIISTSVVEAQSNLNDTDFSCTQDSSSSCDTFITYLSWSPNYANLSSIAGLLGVNASSIVEANAFLYEQPPLTPNELLLIPISCSCNGSYYFYNASYRIKKDDSFYSSSVRDFENLTNYHYVEDMNPQLNPLNLTVGAEAVFPLLCKCPSESEVSNSIRYLITYILQPNDDLESLSTMFNSTPSAILEANNYRNFTAAVNLPVLIPVQQPAVSRAIPQSPFTSSRKKSHVRQILCTVLTVTMVVLVILAGCLAYMYFAFKKRIAMVRSFSSTERSLLPNKTNMPPRKNRLLQHKTNQDKLLPGVSGYLGRLRVYDINVIMEATSGLSEKSRIGGFVYKAKIEDQIYAVKKIRACSEELSILQRVNHANLMQLMGVSSNEEKGIFLVLEYAENGSLDKWLYPKPSTSSSSSQGSETVLTWIQRLHIALDVANGLQYMHEHAQPRIVHRDIRASNILLDSRFKAKIGNLSLAKHAENSLVLKADVFAFGVFLLELIFGKKSMETMKSGDIVMVWKEIRGILEDGEKKEERLRKWIDPRLKCSYPIDNALSLASLARACTSEKSSERPKMADVVFSLCVLAQSSSEMYERSWASGEGDELPFEMITPVTAR